MNGWKWTTTVALVAAIVIEMIVVLGAYREADRLGAYVTFNEGALFINFLFTWFAVKFVLDGAVWLRGKFR